MRIYVGNLSKDTTEEDLRPAFEAFGKIDSITIMMDKYSGLSKGFGFIDIPSKEDGLSAIEGLNNTEINGKMLQVNEARPRSDNRTGFGGGRGGGRSGSFNRGNPRSNKGSSGGKKRYGEYRGRRGNNR
jgi:RNA recognition motif-containing protein